MIKLPDVRNVAVQDVSGVQGVARLDMSNAGAGMASLSKGLLDMQTKRTEYQKSKASTSFLTQYTSEINSYDERTDYENFVEDFRSNSEELMNAAADKISDPRARQQFIDEQLLRIQEGEERVRNQAVAKETDYERGGVVSDLATLRDTAVTAPSDQVFDIIETVEGRLSSAVDVGFYSSEEAEQLKQSWRVDVSTARIEAMDPSVRLEALTQPWASNIPPEIRARIERDAAAEAKETEAINISDSYIDEGLNRTDALEKISKIKDPQLRESVERRFDYQFTRQKQAEQERQVELFSEYQEMIATGKTTIDFIPRQKWDEMDDATRVNLRALQAQAAKPRTESDPNALITLATLSADNDTKGMTKWLRNNSAQLKPSDRVKYAELLIERALPIDVKDGLTDVQVIAGKLAEAEITSNNAKSLLLNKMGDWRRDYIQRYNKVPNDEERAQFIDRQLMEVAYSKTLVWTHEAPVFELDDKELKNAVTMAREKQPELFKEVEDYFTSRGAAPTQAQLLETYYKLREAKMDK